LLEKSNEINTAINNNNPASLDYPEKEIYENWLIIAPYPTKRIELKKYLKNKETVSLNIM
jgi:hypothetical protein